VTAVIVVACLLGLIYVIGFAAVLIAQAYGAWIFITSYGEHLDNQMIGEMIVVALGWPVTLIARLLHRKPDKAPVPPSSQEQ
jgi:hypothetical protein